MMVKSGLEKYIFEISPMRKPFSIKLIKSTSSVITMTWHAHGGISKKKSCGKSTYDK